MTLGEGAFKLRRTKKEKRGAKDELIQVKP
jgi:hypothetical protein